MSADTVTPAGLEVRFLAAATAPGQVRTHLRFRLTEWGLLHVADDVYLIATELITNALEATPDGEIRVSFARERHSLLLGVWDRSDRSPVSRRVPVSQADVAPDPEALTVGHDDGTGGWGLPIVEALSSECGVRRTDPRGKWVCEGFAVSRSGHSAGPARAGRRGVERRSIVSASRRFIVSGGPGLGGVAAWARHSGEAAGDLPGVAAQEGTAAAHRGVVGEQLADLQRSGSAAGAAGPFGRCLDAVDGLTVAVRGRAPDPHGSVTADVGALRAADPAGITRHGAVEGD
nr:hypothetical protein GCM10010200_019330 [Actinomadura rugatobispora]